VQKLLSNNDLVDTVSEPWLLFPFFNIYKPELVSTKYNYQTALKGFFDYIQKKDVAIEFKNEYKKFILSLYKVKESRQYFIDKTPRYYEILPEIADFFPDAKIIILKRNPFAALYSMISTWSDGKVDYKRFTAFSRDFLVAPFLLQDFCEKNKENKNVFVVKYEDILSEPENSIKNIYAWLSIPFDRSVMDLEKNDKVKGLFGDDAYKKKVLTEINDKNRDRWMNVFSDKELSNLFSEYQKYLKAEFIQKYGYKNEKFKSQSLGFVKNKFAEYISELKKSRHI